MDVIRFLESAGNVPMTAGAYLAAVNALDINDAERRALIANDGAALGQLLGGREKMYCSVATPDHEEVPEQPDSPILPDNPEDPAGSPDDRPER